MTHDSESCPVCGLLRSAHGCYSGCTVETDLRRRAEANAAEIESTFAFHRGYVAASKKKDKEIMRLQAEIDLLKSTTEDRRKIIAKWIEASEIPRLQADIEKLKREASNNLDLAEGHMNEKHKLRKALRSIRASLSEAADVMEWLAEFEPNCRGWAGPPWPSTTPRIKLEAEKARAALKEPRT